MSINFKFNQYRVSGKTAQAWSPMAYRLVNKNTQSENLSGFKIGHILYLHHVKGMTSCRLWLSYKYNQVSNERLS